MPSIKQVPFLVSTSGYITGYRNEETELDVDLFLSSSRPVLSGEFVPVANVTQRFYMTGTGTVTINGRNLAGTVTSAVYSYTVSGTPVYDYAYPGDDAVDQQIVLTGTATVEII